MSYYEIPSDFSGKKFGSGYPDENFPRLKPEIVVRQQTHKSEVHYIVKDPTSQSYYKFDPSEWEIISLFDGTRTMDQMVDEYNRRHPNDAIDDESLESYKQSLKNMELLDVSSGEKNLMLMEKIRDQRKERAAGQSKWSNLMEVTFSAWDPDEWMNKFTPHFRFLWTKTFLAISVVMIALMLFVNFLKWDEFTAGTIRLYTFTDKSLWEILVFVFLMTITGTIHEFGHAMTLKHFGGEVHAMGFLLFYLSPAFYVDVSDSYILPRKERLWVTMAGTYTELILCSIATFFWFFATPGTVAYDLSFQIILFTGISSFFINMNPLIKLDGYFAVMDLVEIPDLREESFAYIGRWIKKNIFWMKVEEPEDMTRRKRRIYITYGVLAILYTASIYLLIVFWLRNIFLKTFAGYAYFFLFLAVLFLFRSELRNGLGFLKFAYLDKKEVMLMKAKNWKWVVPGVALLLIVLFIPKTHIKISSPFVVQPLKRAEVRAEIDGFIRQVLKSENEKVQSGDVLAVLENPDLLKNASQNRAAQELLDRELASLQSSMDTTQYQMKLRSRQQLSEESRDYTVKLGRLSLRSPIHGKIVTPFLQDRVGEYLSKGSTFCEVADTSSVKLEIPVREYYVHDVKLGQIVEVKLDAYPTDTFKGRVRWTGPPSPPW